MEKNTNKAKKNKLYYSTGEQAEVKKFIIVVLVVLLWVVGIYFLTRAFVTKDLFKHETTQEEVVKGEVNNDVAIVGTIMNRPYDEYYVAVYDSNGKYNYEISNNVVAKYKGLNKLHIYRVDLNEYMNKEYYKPEEENTKATGVDDFKFGDITLLRIKRTKNKGGETYTYKVVKYITDIEQMKKELGV